MRMCVFHQFAVFRYQNHERLTDNMDTESVQFNSRISEKESESGCALLPVCLSVRKEVVVSESSLHSSCVCERECVSGSECSIYSVCMLGDILL